MMGMLFLQSRMTSERVRLACRHWNRQSAEVEGYNPQRQVLPPETQDQSSLDLEPASLSALFFTHSTKAIF